MADTTTAPKKIDKVVNLTTTTNKDSKIYYIGDGIGYTLRVENEVGGRIQGEKKDWLE